MDKAARQQKIRDIDDQLLRVHAELAAVLANMQGVADRFNEERLQILKDIQRQTRRGTISELSLRIGARADRPLASPFAEWRKRTSGGVRSASTGDSRRAGARTSAIAKRRVDGWSMKDLLTFALPAEFELVEMVELELRPLRKRAAQITATGTRLIQSRFQHCRYLDAPASRSRRSRPASAVPADPQRPEAHQDSGRTERPQFRTPLTHIR